MSALTAAPLAPCRDPRCPTCVPQPAGLADVIDLGARRAAITPQRVYWRRRVVVLAALAVVAMGLSAGVQRIADGAAPQPAVAGTAILTPGDTLWDLAVEHTATGGDVRATLHQIQQLNGFDTASVPEWTVVLLPATD